MDSIRSASEGCGNNEIHFGRMNLLKISPPTLLFVLLFGCLGCSAVDEIKTEPYVDLERFMGEWYVVASVPTFFEKEAHNPKESYRLNDEGNIETTFSFYEDSPDGEKKIYKPTGYIHNKETNAEWRMQFVWPFKMPFLIITLDEDYEYTVIGYPSRKYVWIMARKPQMSDEVYRTIIGDLEEIGYDISKINKVPQSWK